MKKENIIIVELCSSSLNYIEDAIDRGLQIVVFYKMPNKKNPTHGEITTYENVIKYKDKINAYKITDNYSATLKLARKLKPIAVLHCTDGGTELKERLSSDLGLPHNSIKHIPCYTEKFYMQEALRKSGLRYIRSKIVSSVEEGIKFYEKEKLNACVIKQPFGSASYGLHICPNKDSFIKQLKNEFQNKNFFTGRDSTEVLVQEKIDGIEYVVNTISKNGDHNLLSFWRYNKLAGHDNSFVYDYIENIYKLGQGSTAIINYAFSVLDAIHFRNGAVHGEFMVDDKGPVLIEVNCRPMGGNMPASFLDKASGHHETDCILDDIIRPDFHNYFKSIPYYPLAKAAVKFFISPVNEKVISLPFHHFLKHLDSYHSSTVYIKKNQVLDKTVDLFTSPGSVYLVNEDVNKLNNDLAFLCRIEKNNFELLFQTVNVKISDKPKNTKAIKDIEKKYCQFGSTIVLSNDNNLNIQNIIVDLKTVKAVKKKYNTAILDFNYKKDFNLPNYIDAFYDLAKCVKKYGRIIIPVQSYWFLNQKESYVEALCESIGFEIESYKKENDNMVIALNS